MKKLRVPQKYIGIPFQENGESLSGVDCIHLAKMFMENERGIKVTRMPMDTVAAQKEHDKYLTLLEPIKLTELIPGDVPFFSFPGNKWHCGVYIGYGEMLHVSRPAFSNKKSRSLITKMLPQWDEFYIGAIRTEGKTEIVVPEAGDLGVTALIISICLSLYSVVSALTAKTTKKPSVSSKYDLDAITNTMSNQLIYPLNFGCNKVGGNIVWYDDNLTHRFIVLGIGPAQSISDVRLNDIPIANLPGCSYTAYLGTPDQIVDARAAGAVKGMRNLIYLALTIAPSAELGGAATATCWLEGNLMKVWDGTAWTGQQYSQNPAAVLYYILTLPKEDGGAGVDETDIDAASFGEVYDYCEELVDNGSGVTEKRHQMDFVFDEEIPIQDAITEICQPYGIFLIGSEKIYLSILKESDSVYDFDMDNIAEGSFEHWEIDINESYNDVTVDWSDPLQEGNAVDVKSRDAIDMVKNGIRSMEFSFLGLSRFSEASRRAEFIRQESNINIAACSFNVDIDALHVSIGSVVTVSHDEPGWVNKLFRVMNIEEEDNFKHKLTLKEENLSIYNDQPGSVIQTYDYGSPANPCAPVTDVSNLLISEGQYYLHKDGKVGSDINVSWAAPTDKTRNLLLEYIIEIKKGTADYVEVGRTSVASYTIFGVSENDYIVMVKTRSVNNLVSAGTVSSILTVLGKEQPPPAVTGFEVYQEGNLLKASWDAADPVLVPDLARYMIKQGNDWVPGIVVGERVDSTEMIWPVGEIGNLRFMIKMIDTSGNESVSPAFDDVTVIAPPDRNFVNNFDRWSKPLEFKLSNMEIVLANYYDIAYVRPCLCLKAAATWEDREASGKTWEQLEVDGELFLDGAVVSTGYFEMADPLDLETIFEFKLIADVNYLNAAGATVAIQISYSEDGVTYTAFADISADSIYRARYVKFRVTVATTNTTHQIYIYGITIYITAPTVKKAYFQDLLIPITGKILIFDAGFTIAPRVKGDIVNGIIGLPVFNNKTKDQAEVYVYDPATKAAIGGAEMDIEVVGN